MKRIILYCLIIFGVLVIPVERTDVGSLEPIQAVWMYREGEDLVLKTDTEDIGTGKTVEAALSQMKHHSSGLIYLDTAQYLLVSEKALDAVNEIKPLLKGSVRLCIWEGEGELTECARYMQAHKIGSRLDLWNPMVDLPKMPKQTGQK